MDEYVKLARNSLETYIRTGQIISLPADIPSEMKEKKAGVFVSLHKKSSRELRGCIGTFLPTKKNVAHEIISNAVSAAVDDPRFNPLTPKELTDLEINVDVLSEPEKIESQKELNPKIYGVIVKSADGRAGLLLPDIEGVRTVNDQISIACQKAGISSQEKISLYRFTVSRHK
ncbi:MAG: AmmeMemoRadiSam system protein A [Patescibacteria group bacterium]